MDKIDFIPEKTAGMKYFNHQNEWNIYFPLQFFAMQLYIRYGTQPIPYGIAPGQGIIRSDSISVCSVWDSIWCHIHPFSMHDVLHPSGQNIVYPLRIYSLYPTDRQRRPILHHPPLRRSFFMAAWLIRFSSPPSKRKSVHTHGQCRWWSGAPAPGWDGERQDIEQKATSRTICWWEGLFRM